MDPQDNITPKQNTDKPSGDQQGSQPTDQSEGEQAKQDFPPREDTKQQPEKQAATSDKPQILLAEDEEDARLIYMDILKNEEFHVEAAIDGRNTLKHLESKVYDLLLLDIIMPDMDGISVLTEIKKYPAKYGKPKVVMLTNIGGDLAIEKALDIGAIGYMLKSETEPDELVRIIKKYLAGEEHVKPEKTLMDA